MPGKLGAKHVVDQNLGFDPKDLNQPFPVLHKRGFTNPQRFAHFLFDFRGYCQRYLGHRIARCQLQQHENDEADEQQSRNRKDQTPDCIGQHAAPRIMSVIGMWSFEEGRGTPRPSQNGKGAKQGFAPPKSPYLMRYQSATFHSSLSQTFSLTPPRLLAWADRRPR
ncbi:hypothetical protein TRP8649_02997 [Pelagimonas phthalicica]|uniref:Uncharacterized protein n=1 Tax=Pelagimonas phthalicica TaxID=1037362 RepID=A0A238JDV5_9RHOB|nr:hypothetical protein TRP8649_02997 [Pelagimonas phthalicica]